jgi:ATP-dependent RNA helicase DDX27
MLKAAIKQSEADQIRHRIIPAEAVTAMGETLAGMTDEIQEILKEEKEEKLVRHSSGEDKESTNG